MKRTKAQRLLAAACGPALGVLLAVPVGGLLAGAAGADTTCYTGCTTADHRHHHRASDGRRRHAASDHRAARPSPSGVWRSRVLTSRRWRSSVSWRSAWAPFSFVAVAARPDLTTHRRSAREQQDVVGHDRQRPAALAVGQPESRVGPRGARRRFAARTSGEVVAGTDLLVLAVAVAIFAPSVLQWTVAVFVLGVLGVCALRGQYGHASR